MNQPAQAIKIGFVFFQQGYKVIFSVLLFILIAVLTANAQQYTRGVGVYPGDPKEDFSPSIKIDAGHYRNLALYRAAYQSSAYDYNLTAQLITDGITDTTLPAWVVTSTSSSGILERDGREHLLDRHASSQQAFDGSNVWVQVQMAGQYEIPPIDSFSLAGSLTADTLEPKHWDITVSGSNDGTQWVSLAAVSGDSLPGSDAMTDFLKRFARPPGQRPTQEQMGFMRRFFPPNRRVLNYGFKLAASVHYSYYRLTANDPNGVRWSISDLGMYYNGESAPIGGPYHFTSAWKSAGGGAEWVYVDLGAECIFDRIKLSWIRAPLLGTLQTSPDAVHWQDEVSLPGDGTRINDLRLAKDAKARYVRVLMTKPLHTEDGYVLSEMEVYGIGGPVPVAHAQAAAGADGRLDLSGGGWKLQRALPTRQDGLALSKADYNDSGWLVATVPATTLVSYLNDGAVPEPNYGDNNLLISDSYFYSDFWYRDVFTPPVSYKGRRVFLNFDGINWEAEVYLNGHALGRINGAFIRGNFDVTDLLAADGKNVLAVRVLKNDTPGFPTEQNRNSTDANGGELGADNPTFHASIGWDWIPTIRGRNTGIWNKVYLSASGPVTIENPLVTSKLPLPDTTTADISMEVTLNNHTSTAVDGVLMGKFGGESFKQAVNLGPLETRTITLAPSTNPSLRLHNPKLWWPNGYGKQNLYDVSLSFVTGNGMPSDTKKFKTGVREMTYSEEGGALKIWVNGSRFIARGGNWGFAEDLLRYRAREYDIAVRYHKEMNFNMIRNWVGQIDDEAFYDACDKYGVMIWQDFWLANPSDGPDPIHPDMFIDNLKDYVKRIRNHPSIALYVGRNEGNPPPVIENAITSLLPVLAPGMKYIPNSAAGTVSGGGPYGLMPLKYYFQNRATPKLHSEMGMPDVISYESFKLTMPDSSIWPQSRLWGVHDFTLQGAQNGGNFNKTVEQVFGKIDDAKKWLSLAAWTEYQGYRAMYEAQSKHRMGLLIWMSHPSWPSLAWQSYDYWFEPTAAYFGGKKASEPLHIQWNPLSDSVEVVNYSIPNGAGLTASLQVVDLNGTVRLKKQAPVDCPVDSTVALMPVTLPQGLSNAYFVRLELTKGAALISRNEYLRGTNRDSAGGMGDLRDIVNLPAIKLAVVTDAVKIGDQWMITTHVSNDTKTPAFNVRLKVTGAQSGKRILPVIYSDNYINLLPGETRAITMEVQNADTQGEKLVVVVDGFNVE